MPKHRSNDNLLQEVYDTILHVPGVRPIDGRSTTICYVANVPNCTAIWNALMDRYGPPTNHHPLLTRVEWKIRPGFSIALDKADSMDRERTLHHVHVLHS